MSPFYGFHTTSNRTITVEADSLAAGIAAAELETGSVVLRGRLLDGFDNDAAPGRAEFLEP
jgi:hypothetical protein